MGFTIDMVSGNISNITNGTDSVKTDEASPTRSSIKDIDSTLQEQLLPVSEVFNEVEAYLIPSPIIDCDIDSFIDDVTR